MLFFMTTMAASLMTMWYAERMQKALVPAFAVAPGKMKKWTSSET